MEDEAFLMSLLLLLLLLMVRLRWRFMCWMREQGERDMVHHLGKEV